MGLGVSLGLRLATALAAWYGLSILMDSVGGERVAGGALFIGSLILGVFAVVLDASALSFDEVPQPHAKSLALTPWADPRGSAGLQLVAAF
jgi:hypothetical protein